MAWKSATTGRGRGSAEGTELGDRDLEIGEELEQVRLELLIRSVDLVDEQDGAACVGDGFEERALDEEALAVDPVARFTRATLTFGETYLEDLPRIVPVVHRGRDIETFVALQADQATAERGGKRLRDLGLAHSRLAFDEERFAEAEREVQRDGESAIGDVALTFEGCGDLVHG